MQEDFKTLQVAAISLPTANNLASLISFHLFTHSVYICVCVCVLKPWPGDAGRPWADHQGFGDEAVVFRPAEE